MQTIEQTETTAIIKLHEDYAAALKYIAELEAANSELTRIISETRKLALAACL